MQLPVRTNGSRLSSHLRLGLEFIRDYRPNIRPLEDHEPTRKESGPLDYYSSLDDDRPAFPPRRLGSVTASHAAIVMQVIEPNAVHQAHRAAHTGPLRYFKLPIRIKGAQ